MTSERRPRDPAPYDGRVPWHRLKGVAVVVTILGVPILLALVAVAVLAALR